MKYMLIMRAVDQAKVEQYQQRPFEEIIAEMGAYNEAMIVTGPEDFPQDNEWIQKEQEWIAEGKARG